MPVYNFKKETKIYVVTNGLKYLIDIYPDLSFSQTFNETSLKVKTLHSQYDMFDDAVITRANPANFSFTVPLLLQSDFSIITNLLLDYDSNNIEASIKTADLYVESNSEVYKLEKIVVESGIFQIVRNSFILLSISGSASKLSKFTGLIPGVLQGRSINNTYSIPTSLSVILGGQPLNNIASVSVELKNNISWIDYTNIHKSTEINNVSQTMFAEAFVVQSRTLSGNIQQYITDENGSTVNTWKKGDSLNIIAGNLSTIKVLEFSIPSIVYTNRIDPQELYMQSFDFRMVINPINLSTVIKHNYT